MTISRSLPVIMAAVGAFMGTMLTVAGISVVAIMAAVLLFAATLYYSLKKIRRF